MTIARHLAQGADRDAWPSLSDAPFDILAPEATLATPLIFASPHSGRFYPADMLAAAAVDEAVMRRSEDAMVDSLIAAGPQSGVHAIRSRFGRAYIDLNRDPWELDPAMFDGDLPDYAQGRTARVAAGLGAIARTAGEGQKIYARKLTFEEARQRVETAHRPYHDALSGLIEKARRQFGLAVLVDWHSMPAAAARSVVTPRYGKGCDFVLGDRFGSSCSPALTRLVEKALEGQGYRVVRNIPYAGGYTTEHYGRPADKVHALQIEIDRALYWDEIQQQPTEGLSVLKSVVADLARQLSAGWTSLA
jgi:N-formylglutamate amidohydrolase